VFKEYLTKVGPIIAKHGGRALTKAASPVPKGGDRKPELVVITRFSNMNSLQFRMSVVGILSGRGVSAGRSKAGIE
jgi:uncharacterized protein (DUF1330 family)